VPSGEAPARIRWAIELLDLRPRHRVLEIGCGAGVAARLVCVRLRGGVYLGVDRSATAIKTAAARNNASVKAGFAAFLHAPFDAADHPTDRFDRLLAVNVNAFWTGEGAELESARTLMRRSGRLVLVYDPPSAGQQAKIAGILRERMAAHFASVDIERRTLSGARLLGAVAAAPSATP
jgi:SAM-dependent methyltransferase